MSKHCIVAYRSASSVFGAARVVLTHGDEERTPLTFDDLATAEAEAKRLNDGLTTSNVSYRAEEAE